MIEEKMSQKDFDSIGKVVLVSNTMINEVTSLFDPAEFIGKEEHFINLMLTLSALFSGTIIKRLTEVYGIQDTQDLMKDLSEKINLTLRLTDNKERLNELLKTH